MLASFHEQKTIQAVGVLLRTAPGQRMTRLRLLKLLYIAERESIEETEYPITGDNVVAMDNGPVLSTTYDLIKGRDIALSAWNRWFSSAGRDVGFAVGQEPPGRDELCDYEVDKLQEVAARYRRWTDQAIADHTHTFPEWIWNRPPPGSARPIGLGDVLTALGMGEDLERLQAEEQSRLALDRLRTAV